MADVVSFYLRILFWLMLSPSTSTLNSGWCCLLLPPHTNNFLRESSRSLCSGWCCLLLPPHSVLADIVSFYLHIWSIFPDNIRDHCILLHVVSFLFAVYLFNRNIFPDNIRKAKTIIFCFCLFKKSIFCFLFKEKQILYFC